MENNETEAQRWQEEQLRYRVLRAVYDRSGGVCTVGVTASEIGPGVSLGHDDLFVILDTLTELGYLFHIDVGPRVCITPKGIRYIETAAGRRQSIRGTSRPRSDPSTSGAA